MTKRKIIKTWAKFDDRRLVEFNDSTTEVQVLCIDEWVVWTRGETKDMLLSYMGWFA